MNQQGITVQPQQRDSALLPAYMTTLAFNCPTVASVGDDSHRHSALKFPRGTENAWLLHHQHYPQDHHLRGKALGRCHLQAH
jgi:hypothetical protein